MSGFTFDAIETVRIYQAPTVIEIFNALSSEGFLSNMSFFVITGHARDGQEFQNALD